MVLDGRGEKPRRSSGASAKEGAKKLRRRVGGGSGDERPCAPKKERVFGGLINGAAGSWERKHIRDLLLGTSGVARAYARLD